MNKQQYIDDINNAVDADYLAGIISYLELKVEKDISIQNMSIDDMYSLIGRCTHKKYLLFTDPLNSRKYTIK